MTKTLSFAIALLAFSIPAAAQSITDPQIAAIVVTANQVDVDAGKLAAEKATAPGVRKFGQLMATDHTGVNKAAVDLAAKLKVTPEPSATSKAIKDAGDRNLAKLRTLSGSAFDKAYIDNEVAYHQQVLDALDKVLIPGASNAELKALLVKVRPAFVAHLEAAKREQKALTVTIDESRYEPAVLSVAAGDKVVWRNRDLVAHTVTSPAGLFDSRTIEPGKTWTYVVPAKGRLFEYYCALHPTMKATLRIK